MADKPKEMRVDFPKELRGGVYANSMAVTHTREEFILDFVLLAPPAGTVTARVILSPGHMLRALRVMEDNLKKYQEKFGPIAPGEAPAGPVKLQ